MRKLIMFIISQVLMFWSGANSINVDLKDTDVFYVGESFSQVVEESETDEFDFVILNDKEEEIGIDKLQLDQTYTLSITAYKNNRSINIRKKVILKDRMAPRILAEKEYTLPYKEGLNYDYEELMVIDDNYDSYVEVTFTEHGKDELEGIGTYTLDVNAKDSSGNEKTVKNIQIHLVDEEAPKITLTPLSTNQDYDLGVLRRSIQATDNVDGDVEVVLDKELGEYGRGDYEVTASATDSSGNTSEEVFQLHVTGINTSIYTPVVAPNETAQKIVDEAFARLGTYSDCLTLVENCLNAAGLTGKIYRNGWYSLNNDTLYEKGEVVEDPLPGDIIYYSYNSSHTSTHSAVYIGNGMAIHGGWDGNHVAIFRANVNGAASPIYLRFTNE